MPDRIVRAEILTSEAVSLLSWPAEVFYRRLFSVVDDYGRYDGRSSILRAHLYPLKLDKVSEPDVGKWLTECVNAALVRLYQVAGRPYLEVLKFGQRVRADKSKWPDPPTVADSCQQPLSNAAVFVFEDVGVVGAAVPAIADFQRFWIPYPRKNGKADAVKAWAKLKPSDELLDQMLEALKTQKQSREWIKDDGQYIPYASTWLNGRRWEDEESEQGADAKFVGVL